MAILPQKPQELGRIRSGDQVQWKKEGKTGTRPHKLECFRLTSQIKPRLDYAAKLPEYGGEVSAWKDAPGGSQWQLYTSQSSIPVMVPPFNALSQNNEIWQGGECARRCDGCTIIAAKDPELVGKGCLCQGMGIDERLEKAKLSKAEACNTITRLSLMLPDLPGVGIWLYSTKSYYAGMELQGNAEMLQQASQEGVFISAMLSIEERRVVRQGKTKGFPVVTLQAEVTMRQLLTRELPEDKHIRIGAPVSQLSAAPEDEAAPLNGEHAFSPETGVFPEQSVPPEHYVPPSRPSDAAALTAPEPEDVPDTVQTEAADRPVEQEKQTREEQQFLIKAMKLVRQGAAAAGIGIAPFRAEIAKRSGPGWDIDRLTAVLFGQFEERVQTLVDEHSKPEADISCMPEAELLAWIDAEAKERGVEPEVLKGILDEYGEGWATTLATLPQDDIPIWKTWAVKVWREDAGRVVVEATQQLDAALTRVD